MKEEGAALGTLYMNAMLALKKAMGIGKEAYYIKAGHDFRHFYYGNDIQNQDFTDSKWHIGFSQKIGERMERLISVMPYGKNDGPGSDCLSIFQSIRLSIPGRPIALNDTLWVVSRADFINPARWAAIIPQVILRAEHIVSQGKAILRGENKNEDGCFEERRFEEKVKILHAMEDALRTEDDLLKLFNHCAEFKEAPAWPLDCETHGYFWEFSCNLAEFTRRFPDSLFNPDFAWNLTEFRASLKLALFRNKFGLKWAQQDMEDYGAKGVVDDLCKAYPNLDEMIIADYDKELARGNVRLTWGLYSEKFLDVDAIVDCVLAHPDCRSVKLPRCGFWSTPDTDRDGLRDALDIAIEFVLPDNRED